MEVIFGVQAREGAIRIKFPDDKVDGLRKQIESAVVDGSPRILWVADEDGREIGIPIDKLAFVEFGADKASRQVGFSAAS
jgi:hypothetical protein